MRTTRLLLSLTLLASRLFCQSAKPHPANETLPAANGDQQVGFSPTCHGPECAPPDFRRLWQPTATASACLASTTFSQLNLIPQSWRQARVLVGSPQFCGVVYRNCVPIRFC